MTTTDLDREANYFAAHLLVPDKFLAQEKLEDLCLTDDKRIKALAKKYGVPLWVMVERTTEFLHERNPANE